MSSCPVCSGRRVIELAKTEQIPIFSPNIGDIADLTTSRVSYPCPECRPSHAGPDKVLFISAEEYLSPNHSRGGKHYSRSLEQAVVDKISERILSEGLVEFSTVEDDDPHFRQYDRLRGTVGVFNSSGCISVKSAVAKELRHQMIDCVQESICLLRDMAYEAEEISIEMVEEAFRKVIGDTVL